MSICFITDEYWLISFRYITFQLGSGKILKLWYVNFIIVLHSDKDDYWIHFNDDFYLLLSFSLKYSIFLYNYYFSLF